MSHHAKIKEEGKPGHCYNDNMFDFNARLFLVYQQDCLRMTGLSQLDFLKEEGASLRENHYIFIFLITVLSPVVSFNQRPKYRINPES